MTIQKNYFVALLMVAFLFGCSGGDRRAAPEEPDRLAVVATTTLVGDVVRVIGDGRIDLTVLFPLGVDAHSYEPVPRDIGQMTEADLVFINGLGLEASLEELIQQADQNRIISVSDGVDYLSAAGEAEAGDEPDVDGTQAADPHVWFDPMNVVIWVDNIEKALIAADDDNRPSYAAAANRYRQELNDLDEWIARQIEVVPQNRRLLVTDHDTLAYFANRYGFEMVGTIIPGSSTLAEPSSQSLAALSQAIEERSIPAIFVSPDTNQRLARQLVAETGVRLVLINTGSLGDEGTLAEHYLGYMESNVAAIVDALKVDLN